MGGSCGEKLGLGVSSYLPGRVCGDTMVLFGGICALVSVYGVLNGGLLFLLVLSWLSFEYCLFQCNLDLC